MNNQQCDRGVGVTRPLFQEVDDGANPIRSLHFQDISLREAIGFNRAVHSRLPHCTVSNMSFPPAVSYGAFKDGEIIATAIWSQPVARLLNDRNWIELRRMAIHGEHPNLASRFLGWMVRDITKRFPEVVKCISYHDHQVHKGTMYKAARWTPGVVGKDSGTWGWSSRATRVDRTTRVEGESDISTAKTRWEKNLR